MVLLMLALSAFAASSTLHHALHADSDSASHHCLISIFANGQLSGAETTVLIVLVGVCAVYVELLPATPARSLFDYSFAPSRAPPRS